MKKSVFFVAFMFLLAAAVAENYTARYLVDGWLSVTRTVVSEDGGFVDEASGCNALALAIGGTCAAAREENVQQVISQMTPELRTYVYLTFKNNGPDKNNVEIYESIAHVPEGAKVVFNPKPDYSDGRTVVWALKTMKSGQAFSVSYEYNARTPKSKMELMAEPSVRTGPGSALLSAPRSATVGDRVAVVLKTEDGSPLSGAKLKVNYPDGTSQTIKSDESGTARFTASKEGFYTYSVEGYSLVSLASTEVKAAEVPPSAAAAVSRNDSLASLFGILPIAGAVVVIAIAAILIYNFFNYKKEEYEESSFSSPSQPQSHVSPSPKQPVYSQQYSFGKPEGNEAQSKSLETEEKGKGQEEEQEAALIGDDEVERQLAMLEKQAEEKGESAKTDEEIEKAIRELEEIRQKLQERKARIESIEGQLPGKIVESRKEEEGKKPKRILPPKDTKLKFKGKAVKRK